MIGPWLAVALSVAPAARRPLGATTYLQDITRGKGSLCMSPSKKLSGPRRARPGHMSRLHGPAARIAPAARPPTPQPDDPPPAEGGRVPIKFDGQWLGDLHLRPDLDPKLLGRALEQLAAPADWCRLGADLAALGPHRLAIAARAAAAAAGGGPGVSAEEADRLARWFGSVVDEAIRRGGLSAAIAIWLVLAGDSHVDPVREWTARCPHVAEVPLPPKGFSFEPDEPDRPGGVSPDPDEVATFLGRLRVAATGYVHTAIACASDAELHELRELTQADAGALEKFRPWGIDLTGDVPASKALENARSVLTYRQLSMAEACNGFAEWADGFASMVAEHALPPVVRIGAVAWLARVALRPAEATARRGSSRG
jgi:hypothetical protein